MTQLVQTADTCESAWGLDADRRRMCLIDFESVGSMLGAVSQCFSGMRSSFGCACQDSLICRRNCGAVMKGRRVVRGLKWLGCVRHLECRNSKADDPDVEVEAGKKL